MFNLNYIKAEPTTFLIQYKRGKLKRKGPGLSFWYFAPTTSLVAIPLGSADLPFIFKETTKDFQEITIQGQIVYRVTEPEKLAGMMNFTLQKNGVGYTTNDMEKLKNRIVNLAQVKMRVAIENLELREALVASPLLVNSVQKELSLSEALQALGIEVMDFSILAIKPVPETSRALEASVREQLLEEADQAIYRRRNASIDQERSVKENELKTEMAIEQKQQQIREEKLKAESILQEQRRQMRQDELTGDIQQEDQRKQLVDLAVENERKQADANAYEVGANMQALSKVDAKVLEALTLGRLEPQQLLALAFKELAGSAERIGELNISPDLFESLIGKNAAKNTRSSRKD
ncbi:MAG: SPFH domain-containing protein [Cellvibrionaceae bacterium]